MIKFGKIAKRYQKLQKSAKSGHRYRYRKKSQNRSRKKLLPKKKSRNWSQKNLVPKKSRNWYQKKVLESVSFRFWVSSHTAAAAGASSTMCPFFLPFPASPFLSPTPRVGVKPGRRPPSFPILICTSGHSEPSWIGSLDGKAESGIERFCRNSYN